MSNEHKKILIGRAEWCSLHDLKVPMIKAKIDTGAKTSSIHAFDITPIEIKGKLHVKYTIHPVQGDTDITIKCKSLVVDERYIMSSNGQKERRFVITTNITLNKKKWPIELTLSNREPLKYRLLLGREALNHHVIIDPSLNCNQLKISAKQLQEMYKKI